ncbi:MAG: amidohydrolase family protein [Patescibacteria group bacterium]
MVDIHTHIFNEQSYADYKRRTGGRVEKALTIHYPKDFTQKSYPPFPFETLLEFAKDKSDLAVIASVDLEGEISPQIERFEKLFDEKKIVGLKLYPGYQHTFVSQPNAIASAQLCAKRKLPLTIHSGDVYDPLGNALLKYSDPLHVDELAVAVPGCRIIIAHFGFPHLLQTANIVSKNANVYTDISGTIDDSRVEGSSAALVEQYCADLKRVFAYYPDVRHKVLFGTDYAGENISLHLFDEYVQTVENVFPQSLHARVFGDLAKELYTL